MAGSISLSLSQQFDSTGEPLNGGFLYFYAAGTTTPQSAYQDSSLTLAWPNPIVLDSAGRVPPFYLADGQIKIRLTDSAGVTQVSADNLLVVGASSGSGSAPTVDATTILATGDLKTRWGTGALTGFVRANGRTIGSSTSGASERANSDCQTLFEYLWGVDTQGLLTVSTGKGASANADWVANKTISLPDFRSRALAGLGDMGNSDNALFSGATFTTGNSTTVGSLLGAARKTLLTANFPPYTPTGSIANGTLTFPNIRSATATIGGTGDALVIGTANGSTNATSLLLPNQAATIFTGVAQGGTSTPLDTISPYGLVTIYLKL